MIFIDLFLSFFRIGLFAVGGAYSFLPLLEREIVQKYHWLTKEEFLDVSGITQVFPGAISIKFATYTGYKMAGITGAILANLGNILAPMVFIILASVFYSRYKNSPLVSGAFSTIRLAVFAMIIAVAFQVMEGHNLLNTKSLFLIVLSFAVFSYTRIHPAIVIILAGILGAFWR